MILLNFAHPLTEAQLAQLEARLGERPAVRAIPVQIDRAAPMADAARALADAVPLSADAWQTTPLLVNPPGLAVLALALLAEIHGRCGYFAPILNIRPVPDAIPPRFEIAEVVDLQQLRDRARIRRGDDDQRAASDPSA